MEYVAHNDTAPSNVWAIPSDFMQPIFAIILLAGYRRQTPARLRARAHQRRSQTG